MAVAVPSVASTNFAGNVASVVITKPASLAVGDLMIAHIMKNAADVLTAPSGWTLLREDTGGGAVFRSVVYYKIADSGDVAASNFTWSWGITEFLAGAIMRITGGSATQPILTSNVGTATNTAAPSFANGITPFIANSLIVMLLGGANNVSAIGGYAIATSPPTFTEAWDFRDGVEAWMCAAYGVRPEVTATGNSSVSGGDGTMDSICILLAVPPDNSAHPVDTVTLTDRILSDLAIFLQDTISLSEVVSAVAERLWTKVTKPITTWFKPEK